MEIKNYSNVINAYRFNSDSISGGTRKTKSASARSNTDKADFSAASRASFADSLKAAAKSDSDRAASPERIQALSVSIANGTYSVSAQDVANSILGL